MPRTSKRKNSKKQTAQKTRSKGNESSSILHPLEPQTVGQRIYLEAIKDKPIVICDGPAGSGKTFLSFGSALRAVAFNNDIERIVIVRPTMPAGDEPSLGYLPGGLDDKMAPFMAPLLKDSAPLLIKKMPRTAGDSRFIERFGNAKSEIEILLEKFNIEIVPLHLMRGRSFHSAFVILDEAQNCTLKDFKLFLTRIGKRSKVVIEGDATQKDRPDGALKELMKKLQPHKQIATVRLDQSDIVRNPMISEIIQLLD